MHEPEFLESHCLDPPVTGPATGGQRVLQVGGGLDEPALLVVDLAEGLQDPRAAMVIVELVVQFPCLFELANRLVEVSAELMRVGEFEQGIGLAPAVADLPVDQPGLLGQSPGIFEAKLIDGHPGQGGKHPGFTTAVPG